MAFNEILASGMFLATLGLVMIGYPVAFTLAGSGLIFAFIGVGFDIFDFTFLNSLASRYFGIMINEVLVAVPLFVFMGVTLERSKTAENLLVTMGEVLGGLRGGLGLSVIVVGALLAASTGIVGATVVTMGLLSLPVMLRAGYSPRLATGIICASGTLGQIIPPSAVLIFMGDLLQGANQVAQMSMGNFTPAPLSVGQLFAGAFIPGFCLVFLYMVWVLILSVIRPESCPPVAMTAEQRKGLWWRVLVSLLPPLGLIIAVLGSILGGVATPTESASVGAMGALALAALNRRLTLSMLQEVMRTTLTINAMIFVIFLGASVFSLVFRGLGGDALVEEVLSAVPGERLGALIVVMLVMFFLGFFLDTFEIMFIIVPIASPVLIRMGVDPLWLGVAIGINLQTSFLTPPFGFSLFYLRGVSRQWVSTLDIYKGVMPFVGLQLVMIILLWVFPSLALWLPDRLFRSQPISIEQQVPSRQDGGDFNDLFGPNLDESGDPRQEDGDFNDLFGPNLDESGDPRQEDEFNDLFGPNRDDAR